MVLTRSAPAIFTRNAQGSGRALAFDPSFNELKTIGSGPIIIYATGLGPTHPPASGSAVGATTEPLNRVLDAVTVSVGGVVVSPSYAGLAPGLAGIYQINFTPPPGAKPDALTLTVGGVPSNIATLLSLPGANVTNVSGHVEGLSPATGQWSNVFGLSYVVYSAMLLAAQYQVSFDIVPGAGPFQVVGRGPAGGMTLDIDPAAGTWSAVWMVPSDAAYYWNFSSAPFQLIDFRTCSASGCLPAPMNIVPPAQIPVAQNQALRMIPDPSSTAQIQEPNAVNVVKGLSLPAGGHFSIDLSSDEALAGGFVNLAHNPGMAVAYFDLYVDNLPVASKTATFTIQ